MRFIVFFIFLPCSLWGQTIELPYELERFDTPYYQALIDGSEARANTEYGLGLRYLNLYKLARAFQPSVYFPKPNKAQKDISAQLRAEYPEGMAAAFVNFIESEGSFVSCAALLECPENFAPALPYRALVAYALGRDDAERDALNSMQAKEILHPLLLAYGRNLLYSAKDFDCILTNGLQDLLAVRAAQITEGTEPKTKVINMLVQKLPGYSGPVFSDVIKNEQTKIFVAPTLSERFLSEHQNNLWINGLGYAYATGPNPNPDMPFEALLAAGRSFEIISIKGSELNPSLKGLAMSYLVFAERLIAAAQTAGTGEDKRKARQILQHAENIIKP